MNGGTPCDLLLPVFVHTVIRPVSGSGRRSWCLKKSKSHFLSSSRLRSCRGDCKQHLPVVSCHTMMAFIFLITLKKKKKKKKGGEAGKKKSHLQLPEVSHSVWDCRVRWLTVSEVDLTKKYIFEQSRELWTSKDPQCNTILFFDGPLLEQWKVQASIMGLVVLGDSHLASEYWYKNLEAPLLSISYNSTLL